jgi:competence ComEA-like helix-hairpin-helix protein
MNQQQNTRDPSGRAHEGGSTLSNAGGRSPAPRSSTWLPVAVKSLLAVLAAAVLAFIGARAGAHPPPSDEAPAAAASVAPTVADASDAGTAPSPPSAIAPEPVLDGGSLSGVLPDGCVILNVATEEELTKLPGIGPSRARAILALRQRLAKFRAVEDLLRVKGIGRKTLRRIKPAAVLDRPVAVAAQGPATRG